MRMDQTQPSTFRPVLVRAVDDFLKAYWRVPNRVGIDVVLIAFARQLDMVDKKAKVGNSLEFVQDSVPPV